MLMFREVAPKGVRRKVRRFSKRFAGRGPLYPKKKGQHAGTRGIVMLQYGQPKALDSSQIL
jgi:hypothetical protein